MPVFEASLFEASRLVASLLEASLLEASLLEANLLEVRFLHSGYPNLGITLAGPPGPWRQPNGRANGETNIVRQRSKGLGFVTV
jgi:hypothetical protein